MLYIVRPYLQGSRVKLKNCRVRRPRPRNDVYVCMCVNACVCMHLNSAILARTSLMVCGLVERK